MTDGEATALVEKLLDRDGESECIEFKKNIAKPEDIGEYISAMANSAALLDEKGGVIVWGIDDQSKWIVGTDFRPRAEKVGAEELENWLSHHLRAEFAPSLYETCDRARQAGVIIVAAASNEGRGILAFPAAFDNVIGVRRLNLRDHSRVVYKEEVGGECAAVGMNRRSSGLNGEPLNACGTSVATPVVSAAIARILESTGRVSLDQMRNALKKHHGPRGTHLDP